MQYLLQKMFKKTVPACPLALYMQSHNDELVGSWLPFSVVAGKKKANKGRNLRCEVMASRVASRCLCLQGEGYKGVVTCHPRSNNQPATAAPRGLRLGSLTHPLPIYQTKNRITCIHAPFKPKTPCKAHKHWLQGFLVFCVSGHPPSNPYHALHPSFPSHAFAGMT